MNILFSGASGFLGKNVNLKTDENQIIKIGKHQSNDIIVDLSISVPTVPVCDVVVHASGKAHQIVKSKDEIQEFYTSNVQSTKNLAKALEQNAQKPSSFIFISSVAVYGRSEGSMIREDEPLLAVDPYGHSKIQAEAFIKEWCAANNVTCTILRLPLLIGAEPKGNLYSMIKGIQKGFYFNIENGQARKSMLMASDISSFILNYHNMGGTFNLTDGYHPNFKELSDVIVKQLGKKPVLNIPLFVAKAAALVGDLLGDKFPLNSNKLTKITCTLTFDDSKARNIGWTSSTVLETFKL